MEVVIHKITGKYPGKVAENKKKMQKSLGTLQDINVKCFLSLLFFFLQEHGETALHLAVRLVDRTSLHIVDFLTQNR